MEVSASSVIVSIIRHRMLCVAIVIAGIAASFASALLMRPVYRAEVVVLPVTVESGMGDLSAFADSYGPLMALAGVAPGRRDARDEAMGTLRSRVLVEKFVRERDLIPVLFNEKWDSEKQSWRTGSKRSPTMGDALKLFASEILLIREDLKSGLVTVRVDWFDPVLAADWANGLVKLANEELRARAIAEASAALVVLEKEFSQAAAVEVRAALSRLIEAQVKSRTVAAVRSDYAFKVIDPASVPDLDKRVRPTRTLIVIAGTLASALLAVFVCVWTDAVRRRTHDG